MKALLLVLLLATMMLVSAVSPIMDEDDFGVAGYYAKVLVEKKAAEKNTEEVRTW
jgi:hypothetical protein